MIRNCVGGTYFLVVFRYFVILRSMFMISCWKGGGSVLKGKIRNNKTCFKTSLIIGEIEMFK